MKDVRPLVQDRAQLPCPVAPSSPVSATPMNISLFPVAVRPEQFFSLPQHHDKGEAALMYAVLEDAFNCFVKQFLDNRLRARRLAEEAEKWFWSEEECWPFSFINICYVLRINPEYVRRGLQRWRHQHPARIKRIRKHVSNRPLSLRTAA